MKILSIDTSASVASAAVTEDEKLVCEIIVNNKLTHSQTLMPMIDSVLKQSETELSEIDLIAVANGPGSFTGLRIGVSTAKGLADALKKPVVGISTLTAMAYNLPYCEYLITPIMDARRSQVYNAVYRWKGTKLEEIEPPRALSVEELIEELKEKGEKAVFLGDGVPVHRETIENILGENAIFAPSCSNAQRASALAVPARKLFEQGKATDGFGLIPVYLRKSQAEREAEEKEKKSV